MEKTSYKELLGKEIIKNNDLTKTVVQAVNIMEEAASNTNDVETFKELTIGFHKIKEMLDESSTSR